MSTEGEERRAFVVARSAGRTWVHDLPADGTEQVVGGDDEAHVRIEGVGPRALGLRWDGERLQLRSEGGDCFLQGKRFEGATDLKPGDEIAVGSGQLVVGIAMPLSAGGRRALTHHEFRERLYEEMSRAARGGRPTALVLVATRPGEGGRLASDALETLRAGDVVATYAVDELEMLLPDTDFETAKAVVERMVGKLDGVSVGLAVAPGHGDSPERLLRAARAAADAAMEAGGGVHPPPPPGPKASVELAVHDPATLEVVGLLEDAAADDAPVLLTGEKSVGKSVFARFLHERAGGAGRPFVTLHCASLGRPPSAEELEAAIGGTLLLDEVGDLRLEHQRALLAWLRSEPNVRTVATTHRALGGLVERGAFDPELYERLSVRVVEIPSLRNRPEDILPLAERFVAATGADVRLSPGALARLRSYPWPGNVLELRNAMERAARLARDGEILAEHLPSEPMPLATVANEGRLREHVDGVERDAIIKALADSNHNQTHAARRLGISRRALIYKMEKYGLKRPPRGSRR